MMTNNGISSDALALQGYSSEYYHSNVTLPLGVLMQHYTLHNCVEQPPMPVPSLDKGEGRR